MTRNYETYLLSRISKPGSHKLESYLKDGGYEKAKKVLASMSRDEVIDVVKASGLRGRGGAGFPTGVKWGFMPKEPSGGKPHFLIANADESEPGTCKDRVLIEKDPHLLLEGMIISAFAIKASTAFVYIRGEYVYPAKVLNSAIKEAEEAGFLGDNIFGTGFSLRIFVQRGAGAYICGEETGLMESLEGKRGHPRPKPPYPAGFGLWGNPTTVNNVETLCNVPFIMERGPNWFRSMGTEGSPGNALFSVSGCVEKPQVLERPLGIRPIDLIEDCGGIWKGRKLKAFCPGGSSTGFLPASMADIPLDHASMQKVGAMLGCGSLIILDDQSSIVRAARILADFYADESCGQCSQCREGSAWMAKILKRIEEGRGRIEDLDLLDSLCNGSKGKTICPLPDATAFPIQSAIKYFRDEFEEAVRSGGVKVLQGEGREG